MKTINIHQFANVHFICTIAALTARNNHIIIQSISETAFTHPVIAVPGYMRKKIENFVYSPSRVTLKSVGKRVCNVPRALSG